MQAIPSSEEENDESPANEHQQEDHGSPSSLETPKLVLWQGVALLTADCLGVGVLALPHDVKLLGWGLGLGFLIANFPINFFAGNLLSIISLDIEDGGGSSVPSTIQANHSTELEMTAPTSEGNIDNGEESKTNTNIHRRRSNKQYTGVSSQVNSSEEGIEEQEAFHDEDLSIDQDPGHFCHSSQEDEGFTKTYDLISISKAVFENPMITKIVITIYYVSLFLVLGDYILVMARAVSAIFLDQICIPTAGIIASVFMFALCQLKTMTHIGRKVSLASLLAILVVLAQCLFHHRNRELPPDNDDDDEQNIWQQFSAFASIGFAVGSQKLLLNIRHELRHREQASQCLAWSLTTYGTAYFLVIMLAGSSRCSPARIMLMPVFSYTRTLILHNHVSLFRLSSQRSTLVFIRCYSRRSESPTCRFLVVGACRCKLCYQLPSIVFFD